MNVGDSDDTGLSSILQINAPQSHSKKRMSELQDSELIPYPFNPLCSEVVQNVGRISEGVLVLSNYRLYYLRTGRDGKADFNIPFGLIEVVEIKDIFHIYIQCKDARTYRCTFPTNDTCSDWYRRIIKALAPLKNFDELFAFGYYMCASEEGGEEISSCLGRDSYRRDNFKSEYHRLKFGIDSASWRVSTANVDYKLCSSYPEHLIVPTSLTDEELAASAKFRSSCRVPAVVWRNQQNGMVLARSSQPEVGWFCWRSPEDEKLLKYFSDACTKKNGSKPRLLVMDARSYTTAVANRAIGGGCECFEYYTNIDIQFMNLANIHCIRKSFHQLRLLCATPPDIHWHTTLEGSRWLEHMSLLINAALRAATALETEERPVLVHCSDGWDRTTQIVSLAELLLDPYYRTIEGFQVLCEREWLDFGHKFADRCGIGEDPNEKCPVFLQWLDCVHNILSQFPCAFQFSKRYLVKLAEHTYSNLFGTFLCNTNAERRKLDIANRTFSVWKYLHAPHFKNRLYDPNSERILWPKYQIRDLRVWRDLYIDLVYDNQYPSVTGQITDNELQLREGSNKDDVQEPVVNSNLNNLGNNLNSMLESAINCQPEMAVEIENNFDISKEDNMRLANMLLEVWDDESSNEEGEVLVTENSNNLIINNKDSNNDTENTSMRALLNESIDDSGGGDVDENTDIALRILSLSNDSENALDYDTNSTAVEKDCDVLNSRQMYIKTDNFEGCGDNVDELELKLKDENSTSVQTSVETIVDGKSCNEASFLDKTVTNGLGNYVWSCVNGRQQLASLLLDPIDGLPLIPDDIQDRMQQISINHKAQIAALSNELYTTRTALMGKICHQCVHQNTALPEKQTVSDDDKGSVCSTEISWEAVDEKDIMQPQVLWVPDYAVMCCTSCSSRFWLGRRKHHCRSCGKIFCADCSRNVTSLPDEQLYDPVRVCQECYQEKCLSPSCLFYSNSPKQTTCKQAAAREETQNPNLMLPPASPF